MIPKPIDRGLNVAILHIASWLFPCGFDVSDTAPQTHKQLATLLNAGNRMAVWSGGSEATIYGDREVNYAFRAWHDWCHWRGHYDTTLDGEIAVCEMQKGHLLCIYRESKTTRRWSDLLEAEIIGQALYHRQHGSFPIDQAAFVLSYLCNPNKAIVNK